MDGSVGFEMPSLERTREALLRQGCSAFRSALPFPHLVYDAPLDAGTLAAAAADFPATDDERWYHYATTDQQKLDCNKIDTLPHSLRSIFDTLRSAEWRQALEAATGISGLQDGPQPYGAALHMAGPGGSLGMHLDASEHRATGQTRKLNLLLYCTPQWRRDWGGELLLDGPELQRKIAPLFNRMAIFECSDLSWHGHAPVCCPEGEFRRAIAIWYFVWPQHRGWAKFRDTK